MLLLPADYTVLHFARPVHFTFTWCFWDFDYVCFQYYNNSLVCRWKIKGNDFDNNRFS